MAKILHDVLKQFKNKIYVNITFSSLGESDSGMASEKTFSNDELLPTLPLPKLHDSLSLYLDSVKPHLKKEQFHTTKKIVEEFEKNEGSILHQRLIDRAEERRNWVKKHYSIHDH